MVDVLSESNRAFIIRMCQEISRTQAFGHLERELATVSVNASDEGLSQDQKVARVTEASLFIQDQLIVPMVARALTYPKR